MNNNHENKEIETSWLKVSLPLDDVSENEQIITGENISCKIIII
jgi:hypothetical protein